MTLALVEPTGSEWELRQELGLWQRRFEHTYDQLSGVENRIGRALLEHNSNDVRPGPEPCPCERCEVLRGLLDEDQVGRVRKEATVLTLPKQTTENAPARPEPADWRTLTEQRIEALRRGVSQVDEEVAQKERDLAEARERSKQRKAGAAREIKALEAALLAYRRGIGEVAQTGSPQAGNRATDRKGLALAFLVEWANGHAGRVRVQDVSRAAFERGLFKSAKNAQDSFYWHLRGRRFRRIEAGHYELVPA